MRRRRLLLAFVLVACGSSECRVDPSPSCSYRPERGVAPDAAVETFADEIRYARAGDVHVCALLSTGDDVFGGEANRPRCWGGNPVGQLAQRGSPAIGELWWYSRWEEVGPFAVGPAHACLVDDDDPGEDGEEDGPEVGCWGNDAGGQLGVAPEGEREGIVAAFRPPDEVTGLALGALHSCVATAATVSCWGDDRWAQLGTPESSCCEPVPVDDGAWTDVERAAIELSAGTRHTCALLRGTDEDADAPGSAFCWGHAGFGQLGHDAGAGPGRVPLDEVIGIAAGPHHTCALAAGSLWCWGRNGAGELGLGDTTDRATPTAVALDGTTDGAVAVFAGGESGVAFAGELDAVAPGSAHTCVLDAEGHAWCWGSNDAGQLGIPASEPVTRPVPVHPDQRFESLTLGGRFTCGVTLDERLLCWGANELGQLGRTGEGGPEPSEVPVFVESFAG